MDCKDYLTMVANGMPKREGMSYNSIAQFLLDKGNDFRPYPLPATVKRGVIKMCYRNAFQLAEREGWRYVEGYAQSIIPVMHAWCLDEYDNVVDPTWKEMGNWYFGVELSLDYVRHVMMQKETYGVLDCWEIQYPLLTGKHIYVANGRIKGWSRIKGWQDEMAVR